MAVANEELNTNIGVQVIDHLKEYSLGTTRVSSLGVAAELETATALYGVQALKGVSKVAALRQ